MLLHIPAVLSPEQLATLQGALADAAWTDGRETVGAQGAQVKRNLQLPNASPLRQQLGDIVIAALASNSQYFAATLPARALPPRFNRHAGGGEYGFHIDGAVMTLPVASNDAARHLRSDIACTLFLSAPEDYDGGELVVSDTYGEHEIKLPAGDLIVYPASSLHRVMPVTRGARDAAFFWVQSLVRDPGQRELLFQLDTSIQQLTAGGAEREALLSLTGIYHNLLRRWAET